MPSMGEVAVARGSLGPGLGGGEKWRCVQGGLVVVTFDPPGLGGGTLHGLVKGILCFGESTLWMAVLGPTPWIGLPCFSRARLVRVGTVILLGVEGFCLL